MKVPFLGWTVDERFLTHRLRSTSIAGLAGMLVAVGFFYHDYFFNHLFRWDLFAVVVTMAIVKMSVLLWYRLTD